MEGTLFAVDGLNYLFRAFYAMPPLTTQAGQPTGAIHGFCQMLRLIEREYRPSHLCVVFDAPGTNFRHELFRDYKANRPPAPPELIAQIDFAHRIAAAFGHAVLSIPGVEADDVIATLVRQARSQGLGVVVGSSDKDLMQLCTDHVQMLAPMTDTLLGPAEVKQKWGVPPEKLGDLLALMGDSVDNVPGIRGIGPKTAAELINTYGSLDQVVANAGKIKGKKGQAIAEGAEALRLSRLLVRLRDDVPLGRPVADLRCRPPQIEELRELFTRLELRTLLAQLAPTGQAGVATHATRPPVSLPKPPTEEASFDSPRVVTDVGGLQAMATAIRAVKSCGLAVLLDGGSAVRAGLVALAAALPTGQRFHVEVEQHVLGAAPGLSEAEVLAGLREVLADAGIAKHLHDAKSLDVFLRMHGASLHGVASDVMLAGYVLDSASGDYALPALAEREGIHSVRPRAEWQGKDTTTSSGQAAVHLTAEAAATLELARLQGQKIEAAKQRGLYADVELALSPVLASMECQGIRLDSDYLRSLGNDVALSARAIEVEVHALAGSEFNLASPKQLAEVLFGKLGLPVIRKTKTGPSTDADVLEQLAVQHPLPGKIIEYRTLTKLKGTYIDALPALVNPRTGRLHTTFNQAVAATGRLSSSDPNLQNIPIRSDIGKKIRRAFVADAGFHLVSADYSQIELRVLTHFCEDPAFIEAFRVGADIHRRTAAEVFGVPEHEVSAEQRRIAKAINFGLVFGQTDFGLAQALRIPRGEAHQYIESYFTRYARVRAYMDRVIADTRRSLAVTTLLGRTRALPDINAKHPQDRNYAERIARNTPIQGSAADILKLAMLRVHRGRAAFPKVRLLLTVHDELVFEVPEGDVDAFCPWVKREMEAAYELRVPLVVDVHSGASWGEAHS
jgi:DNA polymerase I